MELVVAILATYCVTYFLTELSGPFSIFYKLRRLKGLGALDCFYCTSIWVGTVVTILAFTAPLWVLYPFALAGAVIIIKEMVQ